MPIFVVKVVGGREKQAIEEIQWRAEETSAKVFAMMSSDTVKGYIFIEAADLWTVRNLVKGSRFCRKVLPGQVSVEELQKYLAPEPVKYEVGEEVEVISGPFKGLIGIVKVVADDYLSVELPSAAYPLVVKIPRSQLQRKR